MLAKVIALSVFAVFFIILQTTSNTVDGSSGRGFVIEYLFVVPLVLLIFFIIAFSKKLNTTLSYIFIYIIAHSLMFVSIYPFFSFPSYYTNLQKPAENAQTSLNGMNWLEQLYPEDVEIINYINNNISGQPVILEAQGDSYTDYDRISAYTGTPTIAGWWVHEWLWRGTADVVGKRIPDITTIYESADLAETKALLNKYKVKYIVVSQLEKKKYPNIKDDKFKKIGKLLYKSKNGFGALYQVK